MGKSYILQRKTKNKGRRKEIMKKTECALVQDLIPNYLEQLTSEETNVFIKEHVMHCRECKKILEESTAEVEETETQEKNQTLKIDFLKKVKFTKKAGIFCIIIAIILLLFSGGIVYRNTGLPLSLDDLEIQERRTEMVTIRDEETGQTTQKEILHYKINYEKEGRYITSRCSYKPGDPIIIFKLYSKWGDGGKTVDGSIEIEGVNTIYLEGESGNKMTLWERE